jgi:hypothetical protein
MVDPLFQLFGVAAGLSEEPEYVRSRRAAMSEAMSEAGCK